MPWFVYPYIALYACAAVWTIRADARAGAPRWKAAATTVVDALGLAGMWVWVRGDPAAWLVTAWKGVLPLLVAGALLQLAWWYRRGFAAEWEPGERREPQLRTLLLTSILFGTVAFLPMLWMNARLAFAPVG